MLRAIDSGKLTLQLLLDCGAIDENTFDQLMDLAPEAISRGSPEEHEKTVLRQAVSSGWINTRALVQKGVLPAEAPSEDTPLPPKSLPRAFPTRFARYEKLEVLGEGGMARVFKAYDPNLQRSVALKFLKFPDPAMIERLQREARSQARIDHPNICRVYEAGEHAGTAYVAMQYIAGKTLADLREELTLEQKTAILKQVADALAQAHRMDIIHRDIKPTNIMVEDGEGQPHAYLMDFGLAREVATAGLTVTDAVIGTLNYMSPEQARGRVHSLDARTDIYSLGVSLYEVLSGKLPYEDSDAPVLRQVMETDAVPIRKRDMRIPPDLQTVVMKCLEKDPDRRYQTASDLSDDLTRFLQKEPISARSAGVLYRTQRVILKHKQVVAIACVALLVIFLKADFSTGAVVAAAALVILAVAMRGALARDKAKERAALERYLLRRTRKIEEIIHNATLLPLHDITPQKKQIQEEIAHFEEEMNRLGPIASGPCRYAIARGHMALRDVDSAYQQLRAAWKEDYREPEVAQALGLVLGALYQRQLEEAERLEGAVLRQEKIRQAEEQYKREIIALFRGKEAQRLERSDYTEALLAFYERKWPEALALAARAVEVVPWLHDAVILQGDVHAAVGLERMEKGQYDEASAAFQSADSAYKRAAHIARSEPAVYEKLSRLWSHSLRLAKELGGEKTNGAHRRSVIYSRRALAVDPGSAEAWDTLAYAHWQMASYCMDRGEDRAAQLLQDSVAASERAQQLKPKWASPYSQAGVASLYSAHLARDTGKDPEPCIKTCITNLRRAIEIDDRLAGAYNNIALAEVMRAQWMIDQARDPTEALQQAILQCESALRINPSLSRIHNTLGLAYQILGEFELERRRDPVDASTKSIEAFQKAIDLNPSLAAAITNQGLSYFNIAHYQITRGLDLHSAADRALACFQKCLQLNKDQVGAWNNIGMVYSLYTRSAVETGKGPLDLYQKALDAFNRAIELNPIGYSPYEELGVLNLSMVRYCLLQNQDSSPYVSKALEALRRAMEMKQDSPGIYLGIVSIYIEIIKDFMNRDVYPARLFEETSGFLKKAQNLAPVKALLLQGTLRSLEARSIFLRKHDRASSEILFAEAEACLTQKVQSHPGNPEAHLALAEMHLWRSEIEAGALRENSREKALQAISKTLELNPRNGDAYYLKGLLHLAAGSAEKAREAFEHCCALNQHYAGRVSILA